MGDILEVRCLEKCDTISNVEPTKDGVVLASNAFGLVLVAQSSGLLYHFVKDCRSTVLVLLSVDEDDGPDDEGNDDGEVADDFESCDNEGGFLKPGLRTRVDFFALSGDDGFYTPVAKSEVTFTANSRF